VVVEKEVVRTVEVPGETVVVEKEVVVVKEVPVEVVVVKEVIKEVEVEVVVEKEVVKEIVREVIKIVEVERPVITQYGEAPALAQLVAAGKLPPVEERLPSNPMVIPVFGEIGKYGGEIRRGYVGSNLSCNYGRPIRTGLLRFSTDGFSVVPAVAQSVERNDDGTVWTAKLREGMKWSDGAPFTADDFIWHYDMIMDERVTKIPPPWILLGSSKGETVKVDDYTVEFRFDDTNYVFGEMLTFQDGDCGRDRRHMQIPFSPAHYLKQFHLDFNANVEKQAKDGGFDSWSHMYNRMDYPIGNPDRPSTRPWTVTSGVTGKRIEAVRNPYFYAVDTVGNQLPYIDKWVWDHTDKTVLQLKVLAGEIDFQGRQIAFENYPTLKAGEEQGGYNVILWRSAQESDMAIMFNQAYVAGLEGDYIRMAKFRQALSLATNRDQMNNILYHGTGLIAGSTPRKGHPFYPGDEAANMWIDYDPDLASLMLDEILPNKDAKGFRLMSNGEKLHITIMANASAFGPQVDISEMAATDWNAVGVSAEVDQVASALYSQRVRNNKMMTKIEDTGGVGFLFTFPSDYLMFCVGAWSWAQWYQSGGDEGIEPSDEAKHLLSLWDKGKVSPEAERIKIGKEIYTTIPTQAYCAGLIGGSPAEHGTYIVSKRLRNVPPQAANGWPFRTPSPAYPEQFWYAD